MSWLQLIILALIQGLTEFLPISSSAHLILPQAILGWEDQGTLIDVMAHFGSLFAVLIYFRKDVGGIIRGFFDLLGRKLNTNSALALNLIIASPPALVLGFFLSKFGYLEALRSPSLIAFTTIVFGVLLWVSDIKGREEKTTKDLTWKGATLMGCAQAFSWDFTFWHNHDDGTFYEYDPRGKCPFFYADELAHYWSRWFICSAETGHRA